MDKKLIQKMIEALAPRSFDPDNADEEREAWKKRITFKELRTPLGRQLDDNVRKLAQDPKFDTVRRK